MRILAHKPAMRPVVHVVVGSSGNVTRGPDSIIVDNTDPAISYEKGWQTDSSAISNLRPKRPFNDTLHAAFVNTELTYNFTGSYVEAWVAGPTSFVCFLDGVKLDSGDSTNSSSLSNPTSSPPLLYPICTTTASPKQHILKIMVNGTTKSPIWLDFIRYTPTNSIDVRPARFAAVREFSLTTMRHHELLSEEWDNKGSYIASTVPGASLIFNFTGASVAGLGVYDNNFAHNSSIGSYAIDGQAPVLFLIENLSSSELASLSNQVLFQTPQYPLGPHQIQLLYYGSSETAPLLMTSLLVHNQSMNLDNSSVSDLTLSTTSTSVTPTSTSTIPSSRSSGKQGIGSAAPIIFGLSGAFLGILCVLAFIYYYRWRLRSHQLASVERTANPFLTSTEILVCPPTKSMQHLRHDAAVSQSQHPNHSPRYGSLLNQPTRPRKGRGLLQTQILSSIVRMRVSHPLTPAIQPPSTRETVSDLDSEPLRRRPSLRLLVHEDSGVRLPRPSESQVIVVEVPPTYTPL